VSAMPARAPAVALPARGLTERPRRPLAPRAPRRVSGPARTPAQQRAARARGHDAAGLAAGLILAASGIVEHRLFDRVVRGRIWLGLVTFALFGIVTLQLGLLQLNGSIGRALQRKSQLLRENVSLSIENSALASDEHVVSGAVQAGMVDVPIKNLRFLDARNASPGRAAAALRATVPAPSATAQSPSAGASQAGEAASASSSSSSASEAAAGAAGSQSGSAGSQAGTEGTSSEKSAESSGTQAGSSAGAESQREAGGSASGGSGGSGAPASGGSGGSATGGAGGG
jgi:hypothetical protein